MLPPTQGRMESDSLTRTSVTGDVMCQQPDLPVLASGMSTHAQGLRGVRDK